MVLLFACLFLWWMESETRKVKAWEAEERLKYQPWQLESQQAQELSLARLREQAQKDKE